MAASASYDRPENGGTARFEALVTLHYEGLYRFAMTLTRSESDAADLVQDTFLTWANKGSQLRESSKSKAWLFTTLHRAFLQSRRRSTRFPEVEVNEAAPELPSVEVDLVNQLDATAVLELLSRLEPQYQAAVSLFYLEEYSYSEIAGILEVPLGTVKSRIARGLMQLKELVRANHLPLRDGRKEDS